MRAADLNWSALQDAYGPADDAGRLLQHYLDRREQAKLTEILGRVMHQGYRSSAAPAVGRILLGLAEASSGDFIALAAHVQYLASGRNEWDFPHLLRDGLGSGASPGREHPDGNDAVQREAVALGATLCRLAGERLCHADPVVQSVAAYCLYWSEERGDAFAQSLTRAAQSSSSDTLQLTSVIGLLFSGSDVVDTAHWPRCAATPLVGFLSGDSEGDRIGQWYRLAVLGPQALTVEQVPWFGGRMELPLLAAGLRDPSLTALCILWIVDGIQPDRFRLLEFCGYLARVLEAGELAPAWCGELRAAMGARQPKWSLDEMLGVLDKYLSGVRLGQL